MKSFLKLLVLMLMVETRATPSLSYSIKCNDNRKKYEGDNLSFELECHLGSHIESLLIRTIFTCHKKT